MRQNKIIPQYRELKAQNPDHLLLVKIGDFYEAFGDDAHTFANTCDLHLSARSLGHGHIVMAGVPSFTIDKYIDMLVAKDYKVALAEEIGTDMINGLLPRQVTRVITPPQETK